MWRNISTSGLACLETNCNIRQYFLEETSQSIGQPDRIGHPSLSPWKAKGSKISVQKLTGLFSELKANSVAK